MKKIILTAFFFASFLVACDKKTAEPEIQFSSLDAKLAYRQDVVVTTSGTELKVNLKEIADSRCPMNANCIGMGAAALTLAISDGTNNAVVNTSFSGDGKNGPVQTFALGSQKYALQVNEVLPYPVTPKLPPFEDYTIGVSVAKL